jgi:hypothetical protein
MNISKLASIALLGGALMALGCGESTTSSGGTGGSGGSGGASCQMVETSTSEGTWDITLEYQVGDPFELNGWTATQTGCTVTMSMNDPDCTTLSITGPLSSTGTWTADLSLICSEGTYTANFTGDFSGGPPYDMLTVLSGTDSDGDTITGGQGVITP